MPGAREGRSDNPCRRSSGVIANSTGNTTSPITTAGPNSTGVGVGGTVPEARVGVATGVSVPVGTATVGVAAGVGVPVGTATVGVAAGVGVPVGAATVGVAAGVGAPVGTATVGVAAGVGVPVGTATVGVAAGVGVPVGTATVGVAAGSPPLQPATDGASTAMSAKAKAMLAHVNCNSNSPQLQPSISQACRTPQPGAAQPKAIRTFSLSGGIRKCPVGPRPRKGELSDGAGKRLR